MTILPEEAVKAAARELCRFGTSFSTIEATKSWVDEKWPRFKEEATRALTAALPFLPVQGAVKKLEWRKGRAETPFGPYHVIEETNDDEPFWFVMFNGKAVARCGTHDDEESAIFAAQADYERRILSAIEAASPLSKLKAGNARLEDQLAEARKALEPFALVAEHDIGEDESDNDLFRPLTLFNRVPRIRVGHLRVALAVVREAK